MKTMTMPSVDVVKCQAREPGLEPQVRQQYAAAAAEVNPNRRYMHSCTQNSTAGPMSLPDQIERIGRALTADELASMLTVSRITIFKQAKAGRIPSFRIGTCVRFDPKTVAQWLREM